VVDFPDDPSWQRYRAKGGKLERGGRRRENVNGSSRNFTARSTGSSRGVKFGISPLGSAGPDRRPPGIEGFSQYDKLYADAELWLQQGWLDYFAPQLYWRVGQKGQDFGTLLDYWARQNTLQRHVWPGLFTSAIGDGPKGWTPEDILKQINLIRADPRYTGHIQYSMVALLEDRHGIAQKLAAATYVDEALVPATPWLDVTPPAVPQLKRQKIRRHRHSSDSRQPAASYAIWRQQDGGWQFSLQPAGPKVIPAAATENVVISAVDRLGNESARVILPGIVAR